LDAVFSLAGREDTKGDRVVNGGQKVFLPFFLSGSQNVFNSEPEGVLGPRLLYGPSTGVAHYYRGVPCQIICQSRGLVGTPEIFPPTKLFETVPALPKIAFNAAGVQL